MFYFYLFKASSKSGPRNLDRNGEAQRGLRTPQEIPVRELPVLLKQRDGPPGALVPWRAGRHPHADTSLQGQSPPGQHATTGFHHRLFSVTRVGISVSQTKF